MRTIEIITRNGDASFKKAVNEFLADNPTAELLFIGTKGIEAGKGFIAVYEIETNDLSALKAKLEVLEE